MQCLSNHINSLDDNCKREILRIAELQADDYHMDRPLYYACRDDREHFCEKVVAGAGKIYKCLLKHKFEREMSLEVRVEAMFGQTNRIVLLLISQNSKKLGKLSQAIYYSWGDHIGLAAV